MGRGDTRYHSGWVGYHSVPAVVDKIRFKKGLVNE